MMKLLKTEKMVMIKYINFKKVIRIYLVDEQVTKIAEINLRRGQYGWKLLFLLYSYSSNAFPSNTLLSILKLNGYVETLKLNRYYVETLNSNRDIWIMKIDELNYLFELLMGQLNGKSKTMVTKLWNNIMQLALK